MAFHIIRLQNAFFGLISIEWTLFLFYHVYTILKLVKTSIDAIQAKSLQILKQII